VTPTFTNGYARGGTACRKTANQTVLAITKALTKTTNCTYRAKKVEGHDPQKIFPSVLPPDMCPPLSHSFRRHCPFYSYSSDAIITGHSCFLLYLAGPQKPRGPRPWSTWPAPYPDADSPSPPLDNIKSYGDCLEVKREYYHNCFIYWQRARCYLFNGHG